MRFCVLAVLLATGSARADRLGTVMDRPWFTASPAELLELGRMYVPSDSPVVVLRTDQDSSYDDAGRMTMRWRTVYVVTDPAGVDSWAALSSGWSPSYQDRPVVRARVVFRDGSVQDVDGRLATDAPAVTQGTATSDYRKLRLQLPQLALGAVVEEEVVTRDREPMFAAGSVEYAWLGQSAPSASARFTFSAPAARHAKHHARGLPAGTTPVHAIAGGRETWTYVFGRLDANREREVGTPSDTYVRGSMALATGASWQAVARGYRAALDKRIAEAPVALPAELRGAAPAAIVAWLHARVRFTGIEVGDAPIIPATPADTLRRGAGDCLDKAALLVALLRQAGMRADVALIDDAPGSDVDRELPGLGVFDHALVRAVAGGAVVWIDPVEELVAPGQLPVRARGRAALVVADDTVDLVPTPAHVPADNAVREVRTYVVSESGAAQQIVEVDRFTGAFELQQRTSARDDTAQSTKESLAKYVDDQYVATLLRYDQSPPRDLASPCTLTLTTGASERAWTGRGAIDVWLYPSSVLDWLPATVVEDEAQPRRADFVWWVPQVTEIENRIAIPAGFSLPALPADVSRAIGTTTLSTKYRLDGRTLVVTMRFDSGKLRITPAELATLRRELPLARKDKIHLTIEHTAWTLADRGKLAEAAAEIERLVAMHPKEALHHTQLAYVYLHAGQGEAARREARRAVALEPDSADAHVMLGWVLRHDLAGIPEGRTADRAGALAAYARARKLAPALEMAATEQAQLLETGTRGAMFEAGSDLRAAAEAWQAARANAHLDRHGVELAAVLLALGKGADAVEVLEGTEAGDERDVLLVAANALAIDAAQAKTVADGLRKTADQRADLLVRAGNELYFARHYARAGALFKLGNAYATNPQLEAAVAKVARRAPPAATDVTGLAIELFAVSYDRDAAYTAFVDAELERSARARLYRADLRVSPHATTAFMRDLVYAVTTVKETTAGALTRVHVASTVAASSYTAYFVRDGAVPKLYGLEMLPDAVGREVLRLLAKKDTAGAAQALDWLLADLDPTHLAITQLATVWGGKLPRDHASIARAGALLAGTTDPAARPILAACAGRPACDETLAEALAEAQLWSELDAHTVAWSRTDPDAARRLRGRALAQLGRTAEAEKLADEQLARLPGDPVALFVRAEAAIAAGKVPEAIRRLDAVPYGQSDAAWYRIVHDTELATALALAKTAAGNKKYARPEALATLAAAEAEAGDLGAAIADERLAIAARDGTPGAADWYVLGRIAEALGLRDDAIAAYRRVAPPTIGAVSAELSAAVPAKRRLARLGVK